MFQFGEDQDEITRHKALLPAPDILIAPLSTEKINERELPKNPRPFHAHRLGVSQARNGQLSQRRNTATPKLPRWAI